MRQLFLPITLLLLLLMDGWSLYGQPNSLYFLKGVPQTRELNPARPGAEKGTYFSVPFLSGLDFNFKPINWSYTVLSNGGTEPRADSWDWIFKNFYPPLAKKNFLTSLV